jgi:hypothetical protein
MKWLGIMLAAALLAGAPGYASAEPPGAGGTTPATQPQGSEVKGATPAAAVPIYTPKEKKDYQKKVAAELATIQDKIYDLKMKAGAGPRQNRRMVIKMANQLQARELVAKNQLASLEQASDQTWGDLKTELDKTLETLAKSMQEVEAHLKK